MGTNSDTLDRLLKLTRTLVEVSSLDEALQSVTDSAMDLLPCDHASLRIFDTSRTMLLCGARSGAGAEDRPMEFREGEGIVGWVARHGITARVHDTMQDARFKESEKQGFGVKSILAVPLVSGGEVMGVLGTTSPDAQVFSAEHETLAMLLANCSVPAISRERLERLSLVDAETRTFAEKYLMLRLHEEIGRARRHELPLSLLRVRVEHIPPHGQSASWPTRSDSRSAVLMCSCEREPKISPWSSLIRARSRLSPSPTDSRTPSRLRRSAMTFGSGQRR